MEAKVFDEEEVREYDRYEIYLEEMSAPSLEDYVIEEEDFAYDYDYDDGYWFL
jgi:hypothetical protein